MANQSAFLADLLYSRNCRYFEKKFFESDPILISSALTCVKHDNVHEDNTYRVILSLAIFKSLGLSIAAYFVVKVRAASSRRLPCPSWADGRRPARKFSSLDGKTPGSSTGEVGLVCDIEVEQVGCCNLEVKEITQGRVSRTPTNRGD